MTAHVRSFGLVGLRTASRAISSLSWTFTLMLCKIGCSVYERLRKRLTSTPSGHKCNVPVRGCCQIAVENDRTRSVSVDCPQRPSCTASPMLRYTSIGSTGSGLVNRPPNELRILPRSTSGTLERLQAGPPRKEPRRTARSRVCRRSEAVAAPHRAAGRPRAASPNRSTEQTCGR